MIPVSSLFSRGPLGLGGVRRGVFGEPVPMLRYWRSCPDFHKRDRAQAAADAHRRRAGLGGLGAVFERAGDAWVGYRVARYDPKHRRAVSGADSRLSHALTPGTVVEFPRVGIWLSHDPAYVEEHYANHDHNVLVRFAFDPHDVTRGSLEDRETEIAVSRAIVLSSKVLD